MTDLTVRVLLNVTDVETVDGIPKRCIFFDGYEPGDRLVEALQYAVNTDDDASLTDTARELICEQAFKVCNLDPEMLTGTERAHATQFRNRRNRSLSVGDVVMVGDVAMACMRMGFAQVHLADEQIVAPS